MSINNKLLFPAILISLALGQVEWLAISALLLPPQIGIIVALMKPQLGVGLVVYWAVQAWRDDGIKRVFEIFLPLGIITIISFIIFGLWPLSWKSAPDGLRLFPFTLPIGIAMLVAAIKTRRPELAFAASPFFSVYTQVYHYVGIILVPTSNRGVAVLLVVYTAAMAVLIYKG